MNEMSATCTPTAHRPAPLRANWLSWLNAEPGKPKLVGAQALGEMDGMRSEPLSMSSSSPLPYQANTPGVAASILYSTMAETSQPSRVA